MERSILIYSSDSHFNSHSYKGASKFSTSESLGKNLGIIDKSMIKTQYGFRNNKISMGYLIDIVEIFLADNLSGE